MTFARALPLIALAACASVPMAPTDVDLAAKKFEPPPGHANLYVYRNENFGGAMRLNIVLDGLLLGDTAAMTYLYTPIAPGRHVVVSKAENDSDLTVEVEAGKNYFLWQEVKMGLWSARSALQQVDEKEGKSGVLQCKMGVTNAPAASARCGKDTDCKGTRICKDGACAELTN